MSRWTGSQRAGRYALSLLFLSLSRSAYFCMLSLFLFFLSLFPPSPPYLSAPISRLPRPSTRLHTPRLCNRHPAPALTSESGRQEAKKPMEDRVLSNDVFATWMTFARLLSISHGMRGSVCAWMARRVVGCQEGGCLMEGDAYLWRLRGVREVCVGSPTCFDSRPACQRGGSGRTRVLHTDAGVWRRRRETHGGRMAENARVGRTSDGSAGSGIDETDLEMSGSSRADKLSRTHHASAQLPRQFTARRRSSQL
eukprot:3050222-Rhodomonas_salina.1